MAKMKAQARAKEKARKIAQSVTGDLNQAYDQDEDTARTVHGSVHPSHEAELPRVRRIKGQVEAIERMIGDGRYCVDILQQVKAAKAALQALEANLLRTHLEGCVKQALGAPSSFDAEKKLKEISTLLGK
jgi:CsoR family transcriptional regulator, copper-sensing transcriptional repressor